MMRRVGAVIGAAVVFVCVAVLIGVLQGQMFDILEPPEAYLPAIGGIGIALAAAVWSYRSAMRD